MKFDLSIINEVANSIDADSNGTFNSRLGANIAPVLEESEVDDLTGYMQKYENNDELVPYLTIIRDNLASGKKDMKTGETIQRAIGSAVRYGEVPDDVRSTLNQIELDEVNNMHGYTKNSEHFKMSPQSEHNKPILISEKAPEVDRSKIKINSNQDMDDFNDQFPMKNFTSAMESEPYEDSDTEDNARAFLRGIE